MNLKANRPVSLEQTVSMCLAAPTYIDVVIPRTSINARMRLVTRAETLSIRAETWQTFESAGLANQAAAGLVVRDWNHETNVRYLAVAVRNPEDVSRPLASLDDWRGCDDDQIGALWDVYQDLQDQVDPVGDNSSSLTEAEIAELASLAKKKAVGGLMSLGSRKLARYVTTLVEELASLRTPK